MELERKPQDTESEAPKAVDALDGSSGRTSFNNHGPIPPVDTSVAANTGPSASERGFGAPTPTSSGGIGGFFRHLGQDLEVAGGETVGVAELAGLRYPVKPYEAQVDGGLYRGSRLDDAGMAALKQMGIRGVVNLCLENNDDAARAAKVGLTALHVPILDNSAPTIAQMNQFIAFAQANPPTYVHCEAGKGRTGTAVACYRIAVDGWTVDQALDEAQSFGLSLVNQIAFVRKFAETVRPAAGAESGSSTHTSDLPTVEGGATS